MSYMPDDRVSSKTIALDNKENIDHDSRSVC